MKRLASLCLVTLSTCILGSLAAACDSSPQVLADDESGSDDGTDDDSTDGSDETDDAGGGTQGPDVVGTDEVIEHDETDDECEPLDCDDLDADCGPIADGCGGIVECGDCDDGAGCGILEPNTCTPFADLCVPQEEEEACEDKECGLVGDGCGGSYDCGQCGDGEACGVAKRFQCDEAITWLGDASSPGCRPQTAEAACAGKECGITFDGCGTEEKNTFDCAEISGGCDGGEFCGLTAAFQCDAPPEPTCDAAESCAELGWECGMAVDDCGTLFDCAAEGLTCNFTETCVGGVDGPTECVAGGPDGASDCELCDSIVDCSADAQDTTLTGRVITPGASADDTGNQVGVPNAFVYILRTNDPTELPDIESGIPEGGTNCDRCDEQDLGPVLSSDTTNALGEFTLEGNIPIGEEFLLVVKIGKFRRAVTMTLDEDAACATTAVDTADTRLPRSSTDGIGANLPKIAISTGQIDAMECVFYKMGIEEAEFAEPGAEGDDPARVHMYQANGAVMSTGSTDHTELHSDLDRLFIYDMVVFDCEGPGYGNYSESDENVRNYVNSGGRMFASHLSYTWVYDNGTADYAEETAIDTGLSQSATFTTALGTLENVGTGIVSVGRPRANPSKIQAFADWLVNEDAATFADDQYTFDVIDPRQQASSVNEFSEEFVYREFQGDPWVQQYAFNTPYGAPEEAICGRVAYSAFHVSSGGANDAFADAVFPSYCEGDLTTQEKVLLYMLFDLGACVTTEIPEPPDCEPVGDCTGRCGTIPDGCGGTLDCTCPEGEICLPGGVCGDTTCTPTTCEEQDAECGPIADGCGGSIDCGPCPEGQVCGLEEPNQCADIPDCPPLDCEDQDAECGVLGDGCGGTVDCGPCPAGEVCGLLEAFQCDPPSCIPLTCEEEDAECGVIGDGCGELVDCGDCPPGFICGLEEANKCSPEPDPSR